MTVTNRRRFICFILLLVGAKVTAGFHLQMSATKTIYGVKNSGWSSPEWNWGYARGTGHDCAAICRQNYSTKASRAELVQDLSVGRGPQNFEEVKLVLALAWQRGRWDGSDGGRGGYGDVLSMMASASRYEDGSEDDCSRRLIEDMQQRFHLLKPKSENSVVMDGLIAENGDDIDAARRQCCSLVLDSMGFIDNGL